MSNDAFNAHIVYGSPCGTDAGLFEVADWAGSVLLKDMELSSKFSTFQAMQLREIGEYLHSTEYNEESRKDALQAYFRLCDASLDLDANRN